MNLAQFRSEARKVMKKNPKYRSSSDFYRRKKGHGSTRQPPWVARSRQDKFDRFVRLVANNDEAALSQFFAHSVHDSWLGWAEKQEGLSEQMVQELAAEKMRRRWQRQQLKMRGYTPTKKLESSMTKKNPKARRNHHLVVGERVKWSTKAVEGYGLDPLGARYRTMEGVVLKVGYDTYYVKWDKQKLPFHVLDEWVVSAESTSRKWPGNHYEGVDPTAKKNPSLYSRQRQMERKIQKRIDEEEKYDAKHGPGAFRRRSQEEEVEKYESPKWQGWYAGLSPRACAEAERVRSTLKKRKKQVRQGTYPQDLLDRLVVALGNSRMEHPMAKKNGRARRNMSKQPAVYMRQYPPHSMAWFTRQYHALLTRFSETMVEGTQTPENLILAEKLDELYDHNPDWGDAAEKSWHYTPMAKRAGKSRARRNMAFPQTLNHPVLGPIVVENMDELKEVMKEAGSSFQPPKLEGPRLLKAGNLDGGYGARKLRGGKWAKLEELQASLKYSKPLSLTYSTLMKLIGGTKARHALAGGKPPKSIQNRTVLMAHGVTPEMAHKFIHLTAEKVPGLLTAKTSARGTSYFALNQGFLAENPQLTATLFKSLQQAVVGARKNPKLGASPTIGFPEYYRQPTNAGPYTPQTFPYGYGGRPATYKTAKKNTKKGRWTPPPPVTGGHLERLLEEAPELRFFPVGATTGRVIEAMLDKHPDLPYFYGTSKDEESMATSPGNWPNEDPNSVASKEYFTELFDEAYAMSFTHPQQRSPSLPHGSISERLMASRTGKKPKKYLVRQEVLAFFKRVGNEADKYRVRNKAKKNSSRRKKSQHFDAEKWWNDTHRAYKRQFDKIYKKYGKNKFTPRWGSMQGDVYEYDWKPGEAHALRQQLDKLDDLLRELYRIDAQRADNAGLSTDVSVAFNKVEQALPSEDAATEFARKAKKNSSSRRLGRYAIQMEHDYPGWAQRGPIEANWTSYPTYAYEQFARANGRGRAKRPVPKHIEPTPRSAAEGLYALGKGPKWPIGDLFHARLALIYAMAPSNWSVHKRVLAAVKKAYPLYNWDKWWDSKMKKLRARGRKDKTLSSKIEMAAANPAKLSALILKK